MAFNIQARLNFKNHEHVSMGIWDTVELLNTLVDDSDSDVDIIFSILAYSWQGFADEYEANWASSTDCWSYPKGWKTRVSLNFPYQVPMPNNMYVPGNRLCAWSQKLLVFYGSEGQWDVVGVRRILISVILLLTTFSRTLLVNWTFFPPALHHINWVFHSCRL